MQAACGTAGLDNATCRRWCRCPVCCCTLNPPAAVAPLPAAPPLQVSAAAAYVKTGAFDPARTLLLCVAATAIIGWLNLRCCCCNRCRGQLLGSCLGPLCRVYACKASSHRWPTHAPAQCPPTMPSPTPTLLYSNDVFDSMTGVDKTKPESMVNMLGGNVKLVFGLATVLLLGGTGLLFWLLQSVVSRVLGGEADDGWVVCMLHY